MLFTVETFNKALASVKRRLTDEGRTIWTRADGAEFTRLIVEYSAGRAERRDLEDEIRYSENGMSNDPLEDFCR